ncbi:hypothetical protein GEOBRER4_n3202 [Citrifermentans bremense]|uniref:Sel1 repeat family protein n=1 Tax=Citrifermentans bremense TaxID=60035 RepID=A0A6S6M8Z0_9BACT|nr:tetratricopeptide repeat protein [Citrifermentans bremense]BCG48316.1 hypothetical protein GEOBRER4_n3202 [Citrifermentans bremense]
MKRRLPAILIAFLVCWSGSCYADFKEAERAFDKGDYSSALALYRADETPESFNQLGVLYYNGLGVGRNVSEALHWFRRAADMGSAEAQVNLGQLYETGDGVTRDVAEAMKWYGKAAAGGDPGAQHDFDRLRAESEPRRIRWYRKDAQLGHVMAQYNLADAYYYGEEVPRDRREAAKWYLKAAEQGNAPAQYMMGLMLLQRDGVQNAPAEGVAWLRKAASSGHREAQYQMGRCLLQGIGGRRDREEAILWLRKAAAQGEPTAAAELKEVGK